MGIRGFKSLKGFEEAAGWAAGLIRWQKNILEGDVSCTSHQICILGVSFCQVVEGLRKVCRVCCICGHVRCVL